MMLLSTLFFISRNISPLVTVSSLSLRTSGFTLRVQDLPACSLSLAYISSSSPMSLVNQCEPVVPHLWQKMVSNLILYKPLDVGLQKPFKFIFGKTLFFFRLCCSGEPLTILSVFDLFSFLLLYFLHIEFHL